MKLASLATPSAFLSGPTSVFRRYLAGFVILFGLIVPAFAQSGTGTIEGRVLNVVSGRFIANARVTVVGSNISALSNDYGDYRITGVPAGSVTLEVTYTGLDTQTQTVQVSAGSSVSQDIALTNRGVMGDDDTIMLDVFTVQTERETNAANIAANEQRNSAHLKNVVSADAFGDVTEGNIGEFMKYLPGVTVDYVAADVRTMSVRGFADNFTSVSVNGSQMASAASGGNSRSFEFEQVSINNISRVELVKSPRPQDSASSLGGSINLVSKNAFERATAEFKYRAYLSVNSEETNLFSKTQGPMGKPTFKVLPGFDFDYTLPLSKTFGIVVTGLTSNQYNEQHRSQTVWNHAQAGATPTNPYLQQYVFQDGPKNTFRDSMSLRADWKATPENIVSASFQSNYYKSQFGNRNITFNNGTSATSTPSGGSALVFDQDTATSAQGRAAVTGNSSFRDKMGATSAGNVEWTYTGNLWKAHANVSLSHSRTWYRDTARGHFNSVGTQLNGVNKITFDGIGNTKPESITVYNSTGGTVDWTQLGNYDLRTVRENWLNSDDWVSTFDGDVKRELDFLSFPASLKVGYSFLEKERDTRRYDQTWDYAGIGGTRNAGAYLDDYYADPTFGLPKQQWFDPYGIYDVFVATPTAFTQSTTTNGRLAAYERFKKQNSYRLVEQVTSLYAQFEGKLMDGRLNLLTGVRMESTEDEAWGVLTNGPATTLADIATNMTDRGYNTRTKYDDLYPSAHLTYNVSDNFQLRLSYSKTLGRPDFSNILPLARINYFDDVINDGSNINPETVIVNNVGLLPWTGDSFDLSGQYYFNSGGSVSAGVFQKNLSDFWGQDNRSVTQDDIDRLGLPQDTLGFDYRSSTNIGDARIRGMEFDVRHSLGFIGEWGRNFTMFANATKLDLSGPNNADFAKFIEQSGNVGIDFARKPLKISLKANYRGEQRLGAQTGAQYGATNGFREYYAPRTFIDFNAEYTLSKRYTFFANARNIFNKDQVLRRYNADTPDYARTYRTENFGVQVALGVKGSF